MGWLHRRLRGFRSAVLQPVAARGGGDRPAGTAVHADLLARDRGCGIHARFAGASSWRAGGRVRGDHQDRFRAARPRAVAARRAGVSSHLVQLGGEPRVVLPEPARPEPADRHDVLVVADGDPRSLRAPAARRVRAGDRGRGQLVPAPEQLRDAVPEPHAVAARAVPQLRRGRRRDGAGRGRGRGAAQALECGRGGWRSDPRRDPGERDQSRRQDQRLHGAESGGAAGADRIGAGEVGDRGTRHRLRGGARHGHGAGRSDRDRGAVAGVWRYGRVELRDRLGEVEHRARGERGGDRRVDQGAAADASRGAGAEPARAAAESAHRFRSHAVPVADGAVGVAAAGARGSGRAARAPAHRGDLVVRSGRVERAPDRGGISGPAGAAGKRR
ncbi:putative erythronolide synthase, 6-methylsalicylic acid synthase [Burkholderia gladioli]|uniref:Erythronolide synthase, 6-methylsalicylic acid synthase n=1 Tax=Burkholderia gladioli TaxID=28095 RepID=A0AAW3FCF7_BURGA|nr:putative erythronolide synthase, 6-methylsalicylic acid synthase [Burkholderia gladioli]